MQPVRVYKYFYLLLKVEVLGLVGFMYPLSGLLPWQEPGRKISRSEGSYPRQASTRPRYLLAMERMQYHKQHRGNLKIIIQQINLT
jgi:hypothetical protein